MGNMVAGKNHKTDGVMFTTSNKSVKQRKCGRNRGDKNTRILEDENSPAAPPLTESKDNQFENRCNKTSGTPEASMRRKRLEQRAMYPLMDSLSQKERHKLLNIGTVLPLSGSSFTNAMLKIHNSFRADHGVPPLRLSKELNKLAQLRAGGLAVFCARTSRDIRGIPEIPSTVSENVFDKMSGIKVVASAALACFHWYECAENYDYNHINHKKPGKRAITFMNMIWKETQEMGTGRAVSSNGNGVIVTLYFPKPEILVPSKIQVNVFPPLGSSLNKSHQRIDFATGRSQTQPINPKHVVS